MHSSDKDSFQYLSCEQDGDEEGVVPVEDYMNDCAHKPIISEAFSMIKMGQSFFPSGNRPKFVFTND